MSTPVYEDIVRVVATNLKCSICFELFVEPVTLNCGHTYCHRCIQSHLGSGKRNCPQCRSEVQTQSILKKNVILSNILDLQEAGGREMWNQVTTGSDQNISDRGALTTETLLRRLESLKLEIKKIEALKAELNSKHQDGSKEDIQTGLSLGCAGESQFAEPKRSRCLHIEQTEKTLPADGQEIHDVLLENRDALFEACSPSDSASALQKYKFISLSFSPALGHRRLAFIQERRRMEVRSGRSLPTQSGRFNACQWMADQEFSAGKYYWDVEVSLCTGWAAGVAYSYLERDQKLGRSSSSWCVERSNNRLSSWHDGTETPLKLENLSSLRVILDMDSGQLSFWSLTDRWAELHSFQVDFHGPVRPMFWLFGTQQKNALIFPVPYY